MSDEAANVEQGPSSRRFGEQPRPDAPRFATGAPLPRRDERATRIEVDDPQAGGPRTPIPRHPRVASGGDDDDGGEYPPHDGDGPTNIYRLAYYTYGLTIKSVRMSPHELGLLLPCSGTVWLNLSLFTDVPHGHEFVQRDAWWRAVDSSPAVRFLLGWCISVYRSAHFQHVPREQMPRWSRLFYFSPPLATCSRERVQFWSSVIQDVTNLFVPPGRAWGQIASFAPIQPYERYWQSQLILHHNRVEQVLGFLADRNSCPATLVERALNGNPPIETYDDYQRFAASILKDISRLEWQRTLAMRFGMGDDEHGSRGPSGTPQDNPRPGSHLPPFVRDRLFPEMPDPRREAHFWQLHL